MILYNTLYIYIVIDQNSFILYYITIYYLPIQCGVFPDTSAAVLRVILQGSNERRSWHLQHYADLLREDFATALLSYAKRKKTG